MASDVVPELLVGGQLRHPRVLPACVPGCDLHDVLVSLHLLLGPESARVALHPRLQRLLFESGCLFVKRGLEVGGELF